MTNRIHIGPAPAGGKVQPGRSQPNREQPPGTSFQQALDGALGSLRFSGHAQERLAASRRELSAQELQSVEQAVDRAAQKGSRDTLILIRDLALVVSVKNRTVITAVDGERMKKNIFTNIDSAVIL